jgi:hypothetical protein
MREESGGIVVRILHATLLVGFGALITSCMTGQNATLDGISGSVQQPYVEAFIDYRGPEGRWAGPAHFVVHVVAKDAQKPEIVVPGAWTEDWTSMANGRKPAAQSPSSEEIRARMSLLASVVSEDDPGYRGCLYPLHVRLVRADGNVLDKQGCRGESPWAKAASDAVDFFMASAAK